MKVQKAQNLFKQLKAREKLFDSIHRIFILDSTDNRLQMKLETSSFGNRFYKQQKQQKRGQYNITERD